MVKPEISHVLKLRENPTPVRHSSFKPMSQERRHAGDYHPIGMLLPEGSVSSLWLLTFPQHLVTYFSWILRLKKEISGVRPFSHKCVPRHLRSKEANGHPNFMVNYQCVFRFLCGLSGGAGRKGSLELSHRLTGCYLPQRTIIPI